MGDFEVTLMLFQVSKRLDHFLDIFELDPQNPVMEEITNGNVISRIDRDYRPYVMAYILWQMICQSRRQNVWMVRGQKNYLYHELAQMVEVAAPHGVKNWWLCNHIVMKNDSRLLVRSATVTATRGHSTDMIIIENVDHGKLLEGLITSCHPSVVAGGKMIILEN